MTDTASISPVAADDPGERGRTTIADSVLERIACKAATEVGGVVRAGSGLDKVVGRQYPKATAEVAGSRATVGLDIAVAWPHSLASVSATVRDTVRARLGELSGLAIDVVDVNVATVLPPAQPDTRRVQ